MTQLKKAGRPKGVFSIDTYRIVDRMIKIFQENPDKIYTTSDMIKELGKSLKDVNNPNVRVRMWMDYLVEQNKIRYLGVSQPFGRGRPSKQYTIA
jgi:predicted ArsR family transcriptional regulator